VAAQHLPERDAKAPRTRRTTISVRGVRAAPRFSGSRIGLLLRHEIPANRQFASAGPYQRGPCGFLGFLVGYGRGGTATSFSHGGLPGGVATIVDVCLSSVRGWRAAVLEPTPARAVVTCSPGCRGRFGGAVASAFLIAAIATCGGETESVSCDVMPVARSRVFRHGAPSRKSWMRCVWPSRRWPASGRSTMCAEGQ
jgi:hypothetical protein